MRELDDTQLATTSITTQAEYELGPLFTQHGLPEPRLVLQAHSALTLIVSLPHSDLLAMAPVQWTGFSLTKDALQNIGVSEALEAAPICLIQRAGLPLTPAAEYLCDLLRRAAVHLVADKA